MVRNHCLNQEVEFFNAFGLELNGDVTGMSFMVAVIDALIVFIFMVTLVLLKVSDQKT